MKKSRGPAATVPCRAAKASLKRLFMLFHGSTRLLQRREAADRVVVTSQEFWSYGGPTTVNYEAFEFLYILAKEENRWVIVEYSFRRLPEISPTPTTTGSEP